MRIVLDSDVIIECLRNNPDFVGRLKSLHLEGHALSYTPISVAEIHAGLRKGELESVEAFFQAIQFIPMDRSIGIKAGEYLQKYSKSHFVELAAAFVAASAFVHKAHLFTRNKKHYPMKDIEFV